jgi:hypothetical protein
MDVGSRGAGGVIIGRSRRLNSQEREAVPVAVVGRRRELDPARRLGDPAPSTAAIIGPSAVSAPPLLG